MTQIKTARELTLFFLFGRIILFNKFYSLFFFYNQINNLNQILNVI